MEINKEWKGILQPGRNPGEKPEREEGHLLFNKVAIIGVGLMGGSLGMALRNRRLCREVTGVFRGGEDSRGKIEKARRLGAVDSGVTDFKKGLKGADLVVVGTPVGESFRTIQRALFYLEPGCIITDLGSTKLELTRQVEGSIPPGFYFVGGHPMTGSEESGVEAANPYLLENAIYVLTSTPRTPGAALQALKLMVEEIGAQPLVMDPGEHDRVVAQVSHLPHLAAVTLVNSLSGAGVELNKALLLAAGGFRDTTRVAMGSPAMWKDICLSNREMILKGLEAFKGEISRLEDFIKEGNQGGITGELERARELRGSIPLRARGLLPGIYDLVVLVADVPGVIGKMATLFGNAGINIKDIEILKNREEEGGSLRFNFATLEDRDRALVILEQGGFRARVR